MGITLFIFAFDEKTFENGRVSYFGQHLNNITSLFPEFVSLTTASLDGAIGIFAKKDDDQQPARTLEILSFDNRGNGASIHFKVKAISDINSGAVRRGIRGQLDRTGLVVDGPYLPFCCLVNTEDVPAVLSTGGESQLSLMHSRLDWMGIYKRFQPIGNLARDYPDVWIDIESLNMIGFACAKLAETSVNLKQAFPDVRQKQNFLRQQSHYRGETEAIRRRCIEIQPNNAGLLSNLAYLYYRNVIELTQPGGRRDGNIRQEIDQALDHLDETLKLDNTRVSDLYRKGFLLADKLRQQILFGAGGGNGKNRSDQSRLCTRDGIAAFERAVEVWESYTLADRNRRRYQKDYIKSLYHAGGAYYSLIINDWDEAVYMLGLGSLIDDADRVPINHKDLENADRAWTYFYACWHSERSDLNTDVPSEKSTAPSGAEDGVFKLYWLGKVRFAKFWILSGAGQTVDATANEERDEAERLLVAALKQQWPPENQRQKKDFIAELLARLYISKQEPDKAIEVIKAHSTRYIEAYVATTLSTALVLTKQHDDAQRVLHDAVNNRGNKALWKTLLYQSCASLRMGLLDQARQEVAAAEKEARRQGKATVDTILIAYAFISYKSGDIQEAINYLTQAIALNPHRISVQKRLMNWQRKWMISQNIPLKKQDDFPTS